MRRRITSIFLTTASFAALLIEARGTFVPPLPIPEAAPIPQTESTAQPSEEDRARTLRHTLFKKPGLTLSDPQPRNLRPVSLRPLDAPARPPVTVAKPPPIVPPPTPSELSPAARELALQPTLFTPYDRYTGPVRAVIAQLDRHPATMQRATQLMDEAHGFRYRVSDPYRAALPQVTGTTRTGDCKAKALWLYDRLGDPTALYVIGKIFKGSKANHAWLYWRSEDRWWILDPTNRTAPFAANSISEDRYVPYYSFGKDGTFRHKATWIFMAENPSASPAVLAPARPRVARQ